MSLLSRSPITQTVFSIVPVGLNTTQTIGTTNTVLTAPNGASILLLQANTDSVRYKLDGNTATTTSGFLLEATDSEIRLDLYPKAVVNVCGVGATSVIQYQWLRPIIN